MIRDENGDSNPEIVQVISPYRGEFYGTGSLNLVMQKTFNAFWSKKQLDGIGYYDKVIQFRNRPQSDPAYAYVNASRNNTKAEIFNGEIGLTIIHGLDRYAPPGKQPKYKWQGNIDRFQVVFSGESRRGLRYNYGKKLGQDKDGKWIPEQKVLDNLELAYAISVHKSQGSEFDYVYIVVPHKEINGWCYLVPYEGKLKSHTVKKVIGMFIPQNRNGQEKMVSVSVVKEDRIIYISKDMFKIYEQSLSEPDGIQLKRTFF